MGNSYAELEQLLITKLAELQQAHAEYQIERYARSATLDRYTEVVLKAKERRVMELMAQMVEFRTSTADQQAARIRVDA